MFLPQFIGWYCPYSSLSPTLLFLQPSLSPKNHQEKEIYKVPKHPLVITNVRRWSKAQWNTVQQLQSNQPQNEPGQSINTRDLRSRHIFSETQNSEKCFQQIAHLACRPHIWNYRNARPLFKMPTSSIGKSLVQAATLAEQQPPRQTGLMNFPPPRMMCLTIDLLQLESMKDLSVW